MEFFFSCSASTLLLFSVYVCVYRLSSLLTMSQYNESISLWTTAATKWREKKRQPLNYYIISSSYTRNTHILHKCFNFQRFFLLSLFQFIIFFIHETQKKVQSVYQAHFSFFFHTAEQLFVPTFCITCEWVVLNALQLTMELRLVSTIWLYTL